MTFSDFLQAIYQQLPVSERKDVFWELYGRFAPLALSRAATQPQIDKPIILTMEKIHCLINLLSNPNIVISDGEKSMPALLQLINMGTGSADNHDSMLGQKDPRIEEAIINKAIEKQACFNLSALNRRAKKLAVFGLSGNPPTLNHLHLIQHLNQSADYDLVVPVLNAQSPLKAKDSYVDTEHRSAMLHNMLAGSDIHVEKYHLSRLEMDRDAPSRMILTLSAMILLSDEHLDLSLILGRDAIALKSLRPSFSYWYQWQAFASLCELVIYPREGEELDVQEMEIAIATLQRTEQRCRLVFRNEDTLLSMKSQLESNGCELSHVNFAIKNVQTTQGSATDIRNHYAAGHTGCPDGLAEINDEYIRNHQLFGATPTPNTSPVK